MASKTNYKNLLGKNPSRVLKHVVRHPMDEEIAKLQSTGSEWKDQCMAAPFSSTSVPSCRYYYWNTVGEVLEIPASEEASTGLKNIQSNHFSLIQIGDIWYTKPSLCVILDFFLMSGNATTKYSLLWAFYVSEDKPIKWSRLWDVFSFSSKFALVSWEEAEILPSRSLHQELE